MGLACLKLSRVLLMMRIRGLRRYVRQIRCSLATALRGVDGDPKPKSGAGVRLLERFPFFKCCEAEMSGERGVSGAPLWEPL